ncbi:MAG: precorrin-6y C5,15-methyltransferase (decarboxylating) subunit CbiE, partial [Pseudomonadota bacterium]
HLQLCRAALDGAECFPWSQPLGDSLDRLEARGERRVVVLASGDPHWHGIANTLVQRFGREAVQVLPAVSAFSLAASALGWPIEQTRCRSLHAHELSQLSVWCATGAKLLLLTRDGKAPRTIADTLRAIGYEQARVQVLEHLGGDNQTLSAWLGTEDVAPEYAALNVVALEIPHSASPHSATALPGLPDHAFEHDGQLTKRSVRAVTLAKLQAVPGQCLWDLGAGCGSVAIEWTRAALAQLPGTVSSKVVLACAVETKPERIAMIEHNRSALGTPQVAVYPHSIADCLEQLPDPDAIFIGGGLTQWRDPQASSLVNGLALIESCMARLPAGGRLVINVVTTESEAVVLSAAQQFGGELERLSVSTSQAVGRYTALQPAMAVLQWAWVKASHGDGSRAPGTANQGVDAHA